MGLYGISKILSLNKLKLSSTQKMLLELASTMILESEKKKKLEKASENRVTKRKQFSKLTKKRVLILQGFRCKNCKNSLEIVDFDHIDGNSSNNSISNCQALCPNCHAKKTRIGI